MSGIGDVSGINNKDFRLAVGQLIKGNSFLRLYYGNNLVMTAKKKVDIDLVMENIRNLEVFVITTSDNEWIKFTNVNGIIKLVDFTDTSRRAANLFTKNKVR
jgi:hypothetical protein